jgi:hypothetical protein
MARLFKRAPGCCKSEAGAIKVEFPKESNENERAVLMCAALFLNHSYFEEKKKKNGSRAVFAE